MPGNECIVLSAGPVVLNMGWLAQPRRCLTMSGDIFDCHKQGEGCYGHPCRKTRGGPIMDRKPDKELSSPNLTELKLRNPNTE